MKFINKYCIFIIFLFICSNASAVTNYKINIAGIDITSENKDKVEGEPIEGYISYNPETETLILSNATITTNNRVGIYNSNSSFTLTIKLIGENKIIAANNVVAAFSQGNIHIKGTGSLNTTGAVGFRVNSSKLTISDNCTLSFIGTDYGLTGNTTKTTVLDIRNSQLDAKGTNKGSIVDFSNIKYFNCSLTYPNDATFDKNLKAIAENSKISKSKIIIKNTAFPVWVAGIQVGPSNKDNIVGNGINGKISYNSLSKTLTLDNATITEIGGTSVNDGPCAIYSKENLVIYLTGDNLIDLTNDKENRYTAISNYYKYDDPTCETIIFRGNGNLNIFSKSNKSNADAGGIACNSLILEGNVNISIYSVGWCLWLYNAKLNIQNGSLELFRDNTPVGSIGFSGGKLVFTVYPDVNLYEGDNKETAKKVDNLTTKDGKTKNYIKIISKEKDSNIEDNSNIEIKVWATNNLLHINIIDDKYLNNPIYVYDILGKLVYSNYSPAQNIQIPVKSGTYFIKIDKEIIKLISDLKF